MAKYMIAHQYTRDHWVGETSPGVYEWVTYKQATKFQNYFKASAALATMPIERGIYNHPYKHYFIKVSE